MVFVRECQPRLEELFYPTEERKVERFLALSLIDFQIGFNTTRFYSSKNFRLFYRNSDSRFRNICVEKVFKLAVERNKIKRRIKEILSGMGSCCRWCYCFFCI